MSLSTLSELAQGWGWTLLVQSLYFSVAALCAVVALKAARVRCPSLRAIVGACVLLRLFLPVGWGGPWSARALLELLLPAAEGHAPSALAAGGSGVGTDAGLGLSVAPASPLGSLWMGVVLLWLTGVAIAVAREARSQLNVRRIVGASRVPPSEIVRLAESWRQKLGIRRRVRVFETEQQVAPFSLGLLRPRVVLPAALTRRASAATVAAVIAHELAHVRRWDTATLALLRACRRGFFFLPTLWWFGAYLLEQIEQAADRLVLRASHRPRTARRRYGQALLEVLSLRLRRPEEHPVPPILGAALVTLGFLNPDGSLRKRRLQRRLQAMYDNTKSLSNVSSPATRLTGGLKWGAVLTLLAFLLPMAPIVTGAEVSAASSSTFVLPMPDGRLTSDWGERTNPWNGKRMHHRGIDWAAPVGTEIVAASGGRVETATASYEPSSHGTVVILDHGNGLKSFYSHLDTLAVKEGDRVDAGERLGTCGKTGKTTGAHLHFEVWRDGTAIDPGEVLDVAGR